MESMKKFLATHPNIAKIFQETWFESELQKSHEAMHLLAIQLTFDDSIREKSMSNHLFDHLEENLSLLRKEIQSKGTVSKNLKDAREYTNTIGQIEIAAVFKKIGFSIELEPRIPGSKKKSDIKIESGEFTAYVEVRTLHDREGNLVFKSNSMEISTINNHPKPTIKRKIKEKTVQLSENFPGIIAINLDNIPRTIHIESAFYESSMEYPIISGMLLYHHFYNNEGCHMFIDFFANPFAKIPVPAIIERLFETGGITISTWQTDTIAFMVEKNNQGSSM
jgi:hypothetical protein